MFSVMRVQPLMLLIPFFKKRHGHSALAHLDKIRLILSPAVHRCHMAALHTRRMPSQLTYRNSCTIRVTSYKNLGLLINTACQHSTEALKLAIDIPIGGMDHLLKLVCVRAKMLMSSRSRCIRDEYQLVPSCEGTYFD
jgi:hypothetical protein